MDRGRVLWCSRRDPPFTGLRTPIVWWGVQLKPPDSQIEWRTAAMITAVKSIQTRGTRLRNQFISCSPSFRRLTRLFLTILFGDMSHIVVKCSTPWLRRNAETRAEQGQVLFTGFMRLDYMLVDPSSGAYAPIIKATVTP